MFKRRYSQRDTNWAGTIDIRGFGPGQFDLSSAKVGGPWDAILQRCQSERDFETGARAGRSDSHSRRVAQPAVASGWAKCQHQENVENTYLTFPDQRPPIPSILLILWRMAKI